MALTKDEIKKRKAEYNGYKTHKGYKWSYTPL